MGMSHDGKVEAESFDRREGWSDMAPTARILLMNEGARVPVPAKSPRKEVARSLVVRCHGVVDGVESSRCVSK